MKHLIKLYTKAGAVLLSLMLTVILLTPIFIPKYLEGFATTAVVDGFYEIAPESIDVLFLGSSQIVTAVSPMQLYGETGITSYSLGTEQQNLVTSYYLLKEALQYQNPNVVVLEIFFLFPYNEQSPLNSSETFVRKPIDCMKWSANKLEAIRTICQLDDSNELKSYIFPFLRFHSRWNDLTLNDFTWLFKNKYNPYKGFSLNTNMQPQEFNGFISSDSSLRANTMDNMIIYLNKIITLCKENNISLVLMKTPRGNGSFSETCHNTVQEIADSNNLIFLDFNEKTLFDEISFDCSTDCTDLSHVNYYGAEKITHYLSNYLSSYYSLPNHKAEPQYVTWNEDLEFYMKQLPSDSRYPYN